MSTYAPTAAAPLAPSRVPLQTPGVASYHVALSTGVDLHYVRKGAEGGAAPPLLLVHGFSDSWRSFDEMLERLPLGDYDAPVYAVDLRGHGLSSHPSPHAFDVDDFADDLAAFLDALGIARAVVVGHSMGGLVAQALAAAHPDRVSRLVLIATAASLAGHPVLDEMRPAIEALADDAPAPLAFVQDFQASMFYAPPAPHVLARYVGESLRLSGAVWKGAFAGLDRADYRRRLATVAAPTLVAWGEQDTVFGRAEQEALCALLPDARLITYPDAGHALNVERAAEVTDAIRAFVRSPR